MTKQRDTIARSHVVNMRLSESTYKDIREKTGHDKNYVKRWVKRWEKTGSFDDALRSGAPKKISSSTRKRVINTIKKKKNSSCRMVSKLFKAQSKLISKSTVHRIITSAGMKYVTPKKKPFLSDSDMEKRLRFARANKNRGIEFWKRIVWSDESTFTEGGSIKKVWIEKGETVPVKYTKKFPIKVQVWGAIGWYGKSELYFIPAGKRLTAFDYQKILEE